MRKDDRAYTAQMFARVEGMDLSALDQIPWEFETFEEFLDTRAGRLGVNLGMYVGHSAVRRWVMGDAAFERPSTDDELEQIAAIVDEAMRAGALGFSSSHAPTHLDLADRPVPSRLSSLDELRALADVVGRFGRGSIAYAPESAVEGIDAGDRDLLDRARRARRRAGRHPGPGWPLEGRRADQGVARSRATFLDRSAAVGAPVYSLLMTRPLNGPFTLAQGRRATRACRCGTS